MQAKSALPIHDVTKWIVIWLTAMIGFTTTAIAAPYRTYPGPALQKNQVAILKVCRNTLGVKEASVSFVDGVAMPIHTGWGVSGPGEIALLPGMHRITFSLALGVNVQLVGRVNTITVDMALGAGKTYKVKQGIVVTSEGRSYNQMSTAFSHWWVEISEKGQIVKKVYDDGSGAR